MGEGSPASHGCLLALAVHLPGLCCVCCTVAETFQAGARADPTRRGPRAGIAFPHLFRLCRERFLVGNEQSLRAHLTEFRDHELLQTRCGEGGVSGFHNPSSKSLTESRDHELLQTRCAARLAQPHCCVVCCCRGWRADVHAVQPKQVYGLSAYRRCARCMHWSAHCGNINGLHAG